MYEYLEGRVVERGAARLILEVAGIGYDIAVPLGSALPDAGKSARIWTHFVVREDAHQLYGSPDRATRDVFRLLLRVRGVGPAMALGILSGLPRADLLRAVAEGDTKSLQRVKGVGKKTAEQIVLDLRDQATALVGTVARAADDVLVPRAADAARNVEDAFVALVSIGFNEKDARRSVEAAAQRVDPTDLELLVRAALAP